MRAIRQTVRVLPGGRIEITDAALVAGVEADVVVIVPEPSGDGAPPDLPPLAEMIGAASGLFASPQDVDAYVRALRDEWG